MLGHHGACMYTRMRAGTHDSATYEMRSGWAELVSESLVMAQALNIREQLELGIRFLDLRLAYDADHAECKLWTAHTFFTAPLPAVLQQVGCRCAC